MKPQEKMKEAQELKERKKVRKSLLPKNEKEELMVMVISVLTEMESENGKKL